jgi:hypothetical protein
VMLKRCFKRGSRTPWKQFERVAGLLNPRPHTSTQFLQPR